MTKGEQLPRIEEYFFPSGVSNNDSALNDIKLKK